jgi:Zn-dependent M28 family amino/carboxypeptidase
MKYKNLLSFLLLLSFVFSVSAQKPDATEQNLRKHVGYLASKQLEGRKTGEQGATFAAGYVANIFAQYKLKTGFTRVVNGRTQNSFLQPFPYVSGVELGRDNFLRIIPAAPAKENKMEIRANWMPVGFSANGYVPPAPLVFAGYGIVSNEAKYDDYADLDVKDKFVLVLSGTPDNNPRGQFARFNLHARAKIAQEKGAKAIILIAGENDFKDKKLAQLNYDQTLGETAIPAAVITRLHGAEILGAKDESELAEIEKWIAKKQEAPENVRAKLASPSKAVAQLKVDLKKIQTAEAFNVIGILEGNDPILKSEAVVIGAHYDHLGRGGRGSLAVNSTEIHHGADDNASGVAAMLELARKFAAEKKNKRTLIFIAFGGEEEGLLGSKFYVNNPVFPLDKTVAMINLDMVGRLNENKLTVGGIGTASEWKSLIESINSKNTSLLTSNNSAIDAATKSVIEAALRQKGFDNVIVETNAKEVALKGTVPKGKLVEAIATAQEVLKRSVVNYLIETSDSISGFSQPASTIQFDLQLNQDGFGLSDHSSFYGKQIPVLFFFTGTHADYHKPSDTAEKINYAGLLKITNFVGEIVRSIDQNPKRPTYAVAQSSGMMSGRSGSFNV